jgi:hypothetical protein
MQKSGYLLWQKHAVKLSPMVKLRLKRRERFAAGWLKKFWPANAIAVRINRLLEPIPTGQQLEELRNFLGGIVNGSALAECEERLNLFDVPVPKILFRDRTFCLTGIFYYGSRGECEDAIAQHGGILRRAVSGSTHYVIVGGMCNPQWKHAESGTKIDSAVEFRSENRQWNIDLPRHPRIVPAIVRDASELESSTSKDVASLAAECALRLTGGGA